MFWDEEFLQSLRLANQQADSQHLRSLNKQPASHTPHKHNKTLSNSSTAAAQHANNHKQIVPPQIRADVTSAPDEITDSAVDIVEALQAALTTSSIPAVDISLENTNQWVAPDVGLEGSQHDVVSPSKFESNISPEIEVELDVCVTEELGERRSLELTTPYVADIKTPPKETHVERVDTGVDVAGLSERSLEGAYQQASEEQHCHQEEQAQQEAGDQQEQQEDLDQQQRQQQQQHQRQQQEEQATTTRSPVDTSSINSATQSDTDACEAVEEATSSCCAEEEVLSTADCETQLLSPTSSHQSSASAVKRLKGPFVLHNANTRRRKKKVMYPIAVKRPHVAVAVVSSKGKGISTPSPAGTPPKKPECDVEYRGEGDMEVVGALQQTKQRRRTMPAATRWVAILAGFGAVITAVVWLDTRAAVDSEPTVPCT